MGAVKDIIGLRVGRRVITDFDGRDHRGQYCWKYLCDCGNVGVISGNSFRNGGAISCGCYDREVTLNIRTKHGMHNTPMYNIWRGIRARCHLETSKDYHRYGGRGIFMHEEWRTSFPSFYKYIEENLGARPSGKHSLDRINNESGYEPNNLRWADEYTQKRNTRRNRYVEFGGMRLIHSDWSKFLGTSVRNWSKLKEAGKTDDYIRSRINAVGFTPSLEVG
jgi:hypothetical protein